MRNIVYKDKAIKAVIIICALIMIITVFPLRIWQRTITSTSGAPIVSQTSYINNTHDIVQKIMTEYDRIDSFDLYVTELERGRYLEVTIFDENMTPIFNEYVDMGKTELPGYVNIMTNLDVEVNETLTVLITGLNASFYAGTEDASQVTSPYYLDFMYHDTAENTVKLALNVNYEQPLSKKESAAMIGAILAVALALILVVTLFYRKTDRNDIKLVEVRQVMKYTLNPIIVAIMLALMIMVGPMQLFSHRINDIIFYEIGVLITGLFFLYAVNHESPAGENKYLKRPRNILMIITIALAINFCVEYMNALYTIYQSIAERKEVICLLVLLILTFKSDELIRIANLVYLVAAIPAGLIYRNAHLLADTEKEYDLHNAVTTYGVIIAILTGLIIINLISVLIKRIRIKNKITLNIFGLLMVAFLAMIIIFRNTRWWGVVLAAFVAVLLVRYAENDDLREDYPHIISGGLMLNFLASALFCVLYRFFAAFNMGRFAFVFHTVTVTAEYLTIMECVAMVLLIGKLVRAKDVTGVKEKFRIAWKEMAFFGTVSAYLIFTVSRTGYLACAAALFVILIATFADVKKARLGFMAQKVGVIILSVILCFPAVFTLQRIVPSIVERPMNYEIEIGNNPQLNGGTKWDSTFLMSTQRFVLLFAEKILGKNLGDYDNPDDTYNYDQATGYPIYGENGVVLPEEDAKWRNTDAYGLIVAGHLSKEDDYYLLYTMDLENKALLVELRNRLEERYGEEITDVEEVEEYEKSLEEEQATEEQATEEQATEQQASEEQVAEEQTAEESTEATTEDNITENAEDQSADEAQDQTTEAIVEDAPVALSDEATETTAAEDTTDIETTDTTAEVTTDAETTDTTSEDVATDTTEDTSEDSDISNGRVTIWKAYLSQMSLTGHDEMGAELPDGEIAVHAHNTYLQVMYDNGIISGVLFAILICGLLIAGGVYYNGKKSGKEIALLPLGMTAGFAVAGLSEWVFQLSNPMTLAFVLAVIPLLFKYKKRKS